MEKSQDRPNRNSSERLDVRVEIMTEGEVHYITRDLEADPCDGQQIVTLSEVRIRIFETCDKGAAEIQVFESSARTLPVHTKTPDPPLTGRVDRYRFHNRRDKDLHLLRGIPLGIQLVERGILIQDQLLAWAEIWQKDELDWLSLTSYCHGVRLGAEIINVLDFEGEFMGLRGKGLLALLEQVDFMVAYGTSGGFGRSAAWVVEAAGETPDVLTDLALSLPWSRARQLQGPPELTLWLLENHPQSPRQTGSE